MFLYRPEKKTKVDLNIKCSSCKGIMDVIMRGDSVEVKPSE